MNRSWTLERQRRWVGGGMLLAFWCAVLWFLSPGLPVLFGPSASAAVKEAGRELFEHEWTVNDALAHGDGIGPVFNAKSCVACHFQGGVGGAGDAKHNITNYSVHPTEREPGFRSGTIHAAAISPNLRDTFDQVRRRFPIVKGSTRTENHCTYVIPDFDPVRTESIQPTALFGAGWIDRISSKAITHSLLSQGIVNAAKEFQLDFSAVPPGKVRILADGRVGKFGWKAQFATLEEFVAAACANELGLGTPITEQVKPFGSVDYPSQNPDLDKKQFAALVAFIDTLPCPTERTPADPRERDSAARGKTLFCNIGCAACHTPDLGGVKGIYSDLMLHRIDDTPPGSGSGYGNTPPPGNPPMPPDEPSPEDWKTPPLWGVADSAPYLHNGAARTLKDCILRHGGDAKAVRDAYKKLSTADQEAVLAFLRTLKAPADAMPASVATAKR